MEITSIYLEELKNKFFDLKQKGFIETKRRGSTGAGATLEYELGKKEDNLPIPDFGDIEIKAQREITNSFITLFTKSPDYPKKANSLLREEYGVEETEYNGLKILHTSIFADRYNNFRGGYNFKVEVNRQEKKVYIIVKKKATEETRTLKVAYYLFNTLEEKFRNKLKNLVVANTLSKIEDKTEYFHYNKIKFYYNPSFEKFLELLENGQIMVDIRIGVYHNPEKANYGKTHDHGTGFRILEKDLINLYADCQTFE
jgi:hypothetical protein